MLIKKILLFVFIFSSISNFGMSVKNTSTQSAFFKNNPAVICEYALVKTDC